MGKPLKNPPVYFTVAQARFNTLLKLADYLPAMQEGLRKAGFPAFTHHRAIALQFSVQDGQQVPKPVPYDQYLFANVEQTHSFVMSAETLTFQSTDYGAFDNFSTSFLTGLALLHEVVSLDFTESVGLRYLDHIFPRSSETLEQYLRPEVQGMSARLGGKALHSYAETVCLFDKIQLRSRVVIQEGSLAFPPDLLPLGMTIQARFAQAQGKHAILDTDGVVQGRLLFSLEEVKQQLHDIHEVISTAFRATVTEHAISVWDE